MPNLILLSIGMLASWGMTYITLRKKGCNWFMVSGYIALPKEDRVKYKAKFDVVAMNRYCGKFMYFPLSVMHTLMVPLVLGLPWAMSAWYGAIVGILAIPTLVGCFKAVLGTLGDKFEKKSEAK